MAPTAGLAVAFEPLGSAAWPQPDAAPARTARRTVRQRVHPVVDLRVALIRRYCLITAPCTPRLVRDRASSRRRSVPLLVGSVARPNERPRKNRAETQRLALLAEPAELVRVHPAVDLRVLGTRLEVLPDGDHIHAVLAQVAQRLDDLVVRLAEADDDPGLRQHRIVGELLRAREQPEGLVVARLRATHACVQPADGLDVVVEDVGP